MKVALERLEQHGIFYVGTKSQISYIHCNPYLLIEDDQAVLFEPGSVLDFEEVKKNVEHYISLDKITYIVISHPDPDLASSLPLFEKAGLHAKVVCDWRTYNILKYYGITSPIYSLQQHNKQLRLNTGRVLEFIRAPFTHYSGNFLTYDTQSKSLFSGDLFGGYSKGWELFAGEDYNEAMATYHENYMPSSDFIRPIMKKLLKMDILYILPQHGSILRDEQVRKSIVFLYKLNFYNNSYQVVNVKNNRREYNFHSFLNQMLLRLNNLYSIDEILEVFDNTTIEIDPETLSVISQHENKYRLWNHFFEQIYLKKGHEWLAILESVVKKIVRLYNVKPPKIYQAQAVDSSMKLSQLEAEKEEMLKKIDAISENKGQGDQDDLRCQITNLRLTDAFKELVREDLQSDEVINDINGVIYISIDNMDEINAEHTIRIGDETIRIASVKIKDITNTETLVFKHFGAGFFIYLPKSDISTIYSKALELRNELGESDSFIEQISVSISIVRLSELVSIDIDDQVNELFTKLETRMIESQRYGGGHIVDHQNESELFDGKILLIDEDDIYQNILMRVFQLHNYDVVIAQDVYEAMTIIEKQRIDVIISEINLSKLDGFALKKQLNETTKYANIPFILVSHNKNHNSIIKANHLDIDFIVQKPFYHEEIVGLVQRLQRREIKNG
ncbi:MAG: response regulator [Candidatus Izemoplasma sp.]|nr:response regulator [Candidatus Izemoplasma sp.]